MGDSGDAISTGGDALIAAAREAMINASKHAEVDRIDVFVERSATAIEVFIRDTGIGFDPDMIGSARRGLSQSIAGRMSRAGGTATIHSEVGQGTEVELILPIATSLNGAEAPPFGEVRTEGGDS